MSENERKMSENEREMSVHDREISGNGEEIPVPDRGMSVSEREMSIHEQVKRSSRLESQISISASAISKHGSQQSGAHSIYHRFFGSSSNTSLQNTDIAEEHHHARLGEYAAKLWKDKDLTDVLIVVQTREFKAHKAVLACYSPYFKEVLLKPGANNVHYMEIPSVTAKAFDILLTYMYTGEMILTCQDLADVYRAARRLGMKDALNKCLELLSVSANHIENTIHLYVTSKKLNLQEPATKAFKLMTTHFETLIESAEFLDLNEDQLLEFFSADEIGARSELMVYLAALSWLNYKFLERESSIRRVVKVIRFPLMTLEEIVHCFHPPVLPGIVHYPAVREEMLNGTAFVAAKSFGQEALFKDYSCSLRNYLLAGEPIILWNCAGLYNPDLYEDYRDSIAATKIQAIFRGYSARRDVDDVVYKRERAATVIQATFRSYVERQKVRKLMENYRRKQKEKLTFDQGHIDWHTPVSEVTVRPREGSILMPDSFCEIKATIYVIGGLDTHKEHPVTNLILSYNPVAKDEWKEIACIPEPRHDIKVIFLGNELYCIGGCVPRDANTKMLVPKADCYRYHLTSENWIPMAPMCNARAFHGVAILNNLIYAIGGKNDHTKILSSAECYNPLTNTWMEIEDMFLPRMGMGTATYSEKIWVAGGLTTHGKKMILIDDVEAFDPSISRWLKRAKLPMPTAFTALVSTNEELYCIGGAIQETPDAQEMISRDEVYEFELRDHYWKKYATLPMPLHTPITLGLCGKIYVLGGYCSQQGSILKEVFYFDCRTKKWYPSCYVPMETVSYVVSAYASEN